MLGYADWGDWGVGETDRVYAYSEPSHPLCAAPAPHPCVKRPRNDCHGTSGAAGHGTMAEVWSSAPPYAVAAKRVRTS